MSHDEWWNVWEAGPNFWVRCDDGCKVAFLGTEEGGFVWSGASIETVRRWAALIAAAPQMHDALQVVLDELRKQMRAEIFNPKLSAEILEPLATKVWQALADADGRDRHNPPDWSKD